MRKISAWLLAAALALSLLPTAFAAEETVITVHPPGGSVKAGDTFTVTVDISGNPGVSSMGFVLTYDESQMECTDVISGDLTRGSSAIAGGNPKAGAGAKYGLASAEPLADDKTIAVFKFTAKQDISPDGFELHDVILSDATDNKIQAVVRVQSPEGTITSEKPISSLDTSPTPTTQPSTTTQPEQTKPAETTPAPTPTTTPTTQPVTPTQIPGGADIAFTDTAGHWAANWITLAARRGIFKGNPDGSFKPNNPVSRGDYVLTLYRMAGEPYVEMTASPFPDVPATAYYAKAVAWAYANGYVSGRGNGFDPSASVTRQEAMKILFAYAGGQSGMELVLAGVYDQSFADSAEIADWAKASLYWAVYHEIINGMDGGLNPTGQTTRAQIAKILVEYQDRAEREAAQAAQNQQNN